MIIISGDQTGVERATLDAALENQLKIEGYCLPERKAEDGTLPKQYSLKELDPNLYSESNTALYSIRNEENFKLAEKMLVLNISNIKFDNEKLPVIEGKETKIIHLEENFEDNKNKIQLITKWIKSQNVQKLFITGPKKSNNDRVIVYDIAHEFLHNLFISYRPKEKK